MFGPILVIVASALAFAPASSAQQAPPRATATAAPPAKPPPPAFEPGMPVVDNRGAVIGRFKSLAESDAGAMAIIEIDGKLVGTPQSSLTLEGDRIRSARSKSEIVAAAGAPR